MRFSSAFPATVCLAILALSLGDAQAEKRVALIIGNSVYKHVSKLPNPANDAAAIAALLKRSGFDVVENRSDLKFGDMGRVIRSFADDTRDADIAVVFYAGRGIEVDGVNYLIPVDAVLEHDLDVEYEAHPLDRIIKVLEPVKRLRLVILDDCRDNPFTRSMKRSVASRSIGRGLAKIEVVTSDTLIAFAAKAGSTAADGDGKNSPFTAALLNNLATPGLDLQLSLGRVRDEVLSATKGKQEPFVYGSLGGSTVALVPAVQRPAADAALAPTPNAEEAVRRDYELAADIGTKEVWERFLRRHPSGFYSDLASAALHKLEAEATKTASRPKPDDNVDKPTAATRSAPKATSKPERGLSPRTTRQNDRPAGSGGEQVFCGSGGCRTIPKNCRVDRPSGIPGNANVPLVRCN